MLGDATRASVETRACPGPAAPWSPAGCKVLAITRHFSNRPSRCLASQHLSMLYPTRPSYELIGAGGDAVKGQICRGGGQRRAEALRGTERGGRVLWLCWRQPPFPPPTDQAVIPIWGPRPWLAGQAKVCRWAAVNALSWLQSRDRLILCRGVWAGEQLGQEPGPPFQEGHVEQGFGEKKADPRQLLAFLDCHAICWKTALSQDRLPGIGSLQNSSKREL